MTKPKPWRRDALRWALRYGVASMGLALVYFAERYAPPELTWLQRLNYSAWIAIGFGIVCGVIVFVVRYTGYLLDLDELESGGRGGLDLPRHPRRGKSDPNEGEGSGHH